MSKANWKAAAVRPSCSLNVQGRNNYKRSVGIVANSLARYSFCSFLDKLNKCPLQNLNKYPSLPVARSSMQLIEQTAFRGLSVRPSIRRSDVNHLSPPAAVYCNRPSFERPPRTYAIERSFVRFEGPSLPIFASACFDRYSSSCSTTTLSERPSGLPSSSSVNTRVQGSELFSRASSFLPSHSWLKVTLPPASCFSR